MAKTYYLQFGAGDPRPFVGLAPTFLCFSNNGAAVTPPAISGVAGATGFYSFTWGTTTPIIFLADAATTSPGTAGRYVSGTLDPADRADEYGTTMVAIGTTLIGYGISTIAFGLTLTGFGTSTIAFGSTLIGYGNSTVAFGSTLIGYGNSTLAFGTTIVAIGTSLLAQGVTNQAIGTSLYGLIGTTADSFGSTGVDPTTLFGFLKRNQEFWEGNEIYTKATGLFDFYSRGSSTLLREKTISDSSSTTTKS